MHTTLLAWLFLSFFVVGSVSQTPTATGTAAATATNSVTVTETGSLSVSFSGSLSVSYSGSLTISNSVSVTQTETLSITLSNSLTVTNTQSNSLSTSTSGSFSLSISGSVNSYNSPFNFKSESVKRIRAIQCKYANPNLYCKWQQGDIGYKRVRLQVECLANPLGNKMYGFLAVYNSSTPHYKCSTNPAAQQTTLVSLDLPPNTYCQGILTLREYSKFKGKCANSTDSVAYEDSRFWFKGKGPYPTGFFLTGPSILMTSS